MLETIIFVCYIINNLYIRIQSYCFHTCLLGYIVGEPVIAGRLSSSVIELSGDRNRYLTVISPRADGTCVSDSTLRASVRFGENLRTGCLLRLSYDELRTDCSALLDNTIQALLGPDRTLDTDGSIYIASFGNSNPLKVGDWVPILVTSPPSGVSCVGVAMHLEILYSYVGDLGNPQAMITGSKLYFDTIDNKFMCVGSYCLSENLDATQNFEVVSSVAFIDVSAAPEAVFAEVPVTEARLDENFFEPYSAQSRATRSVFQLTSTFISLCVHHIIVILFFY